jgi:hypothetical protein
MTIVISMNSLFTFPNLKELMIKSTNILNVSSSFKRKFSRSIESHDGKIIKRAEKNLLYLVNEENTNVKKL